MDIRPYGLSSDAASTYRVFQAAVRITAAKAYTTEQIAAWAGPEADATDLAAWDARRAAATTFVATIDDQVVGFIDLLPSGLIDMLFVSPEASGRGIATALLGHVREVATARGIAELHTYASRSAQPVFARHGFTLVHDRPDNVVRGVTVPNAEMRSKL